MIQISQPGVGPEWLTNVEIWLTNIQIGFTDVLIVWLVEHRY